MSRESLTNSIIDAVRPWMAPSVLDIEHPDLKIRMSAGHNRQHLVESLHAALQGADVDRAQLANTLEAIGTVKESLQRMREDLRERWATRGENGDYSYGDLELGPIDSLLSEQIALIRDQFGSSIRLKDRVEEIRSLTRRAA